MNKVHAAVDTILRNCSCPQVLLLSPFALESLSREIMRRGMDVLWGSRSVALHYIDFMVLTSLIFESATRNNSHHDLLCSIARDSRIWECVLRVLQDQEHHFTICLAFEMDLVIHMVPYISGQSANYLLSNSRFLLCLTLLFCHSVSHVVSLAATVYTMLLLGKQGSRVLEKLLVDDTLTKVIQLVFTRFLDDDPLYFHDCSGTNDSEGCSCEDFAASSRFSALYAVLKVL